MRQLLLWLSFIVVLQAEKLSVTDEPKFEKNSDKTESLSIDGVDYKSSTKDEGSNYLEKVFSGNIGFSFFDSETSSRESYFGALRYEDIFFDFIKAKIEYQASQTKVTQTLTLGQFGEVGAQETIEIERKYNTSGFKEAYVDVSLGRYASVSVGKQVIVWGQFDILSPIDAVLPFVESSGIMSMSKAQNRLPMNVGILKLYPTDKLHIEAYYFPQITRDPMVQDIIDDGVIYYDNNSSNFNNTNFEFILSHADVEQPEDEAHHAFRVIYYGDSFTLGVTKFDGYEKYFSFNENISNAGTYNLTGVAPKVEKLNMTGVELSIPVNRWTWKIDYEAHTFNESLRGYGAYLEYNSMDAEQLEFNNWVLNQNEGKLYIPIEVQISAIGFEYNSDQWSTSFGLLSFSREFKDSEQKRRYNQSIDIHARLYGDDGEEVTSIPMFNTTRYLDEDKEQAWGVAMGMFGGASGLTIYYKDVVAESLTYGISYDYLTYSTDILTEEGRYEAEENTGGIRYFASYKF